MEEDDYHIGFLVDYTNRRGKSIGNPDLFRKALYERYFNVEKLGATITKPETCYSGTLYLETERVDDVIVRPNRTFTSIMKDFINLEIHVAFGLSLKEYMDLTPKDIIAMNSVARDRIRENKEQLKKDLGKDLNLF